MQSGLKLLGNSIVKFIYSEKATKFCEIFSLILTTAYTVKSKGKISQNLVAFSEYINFKYFIVVRWNFRSVRLWLLRDSGQYWPSVCHYMGAAATAIHYRHQSMQLFIGLDNGTVSEFIVSEDFNRMDHARDYHAHQSRVTGIHVTSEGKLEF